MFCKVLNLSQMQVTNAIFVSMALETSVPCGRGGMVFTFDKSKGLAIGASLVEDDKMELVRFHSKY